MTPRRRETFEPVTLGHIRSHGCRDILIYCESIWCNHSAKLNADWLPDPCIGISPKMALRVRGRDQCRTQRCQIYLDISRIYTSHDGLIGSEADAGKKWPPSHSRLRIITNTTRTRVLFVGGWSCTQITSEVGAFRERPTAESFSVG
jgi:hypothetical protein